MGQVTNSLCSRRVIEFDFHREFAANKLQPSPETKDCCQFGETRRRWCVG
jgi:hypothetical protein